MTLSGALQAMLCAAVALGGCDLLLPFASSHSADASRPARPADAGPSNERSPHGGDAARRDTGKRRDADPADRLFSESSHGGDGPAGAPPSCAVGGAPLKVYSSLMVQCDFGIAVFNQCAAATRCNVAAGWHLCSASEYLQHGGKLQQPPAKAAWIGACLRDGGTPASLFAKTACGACDGTTSSLEVAWNCDGTSLGGLGLLAGRNLGVHTYGMCRRVGANLASNEGLWTAVDAGFLQLAGAVCCK